MNLALDHASLKARQRKLLTMRMFAATFERLYVLRNQVMHGGATWHSSFNRDQIRDGANILGVSAETFVDAE